MRSCSRNSGRDPVRGIPGAFLFAGGRVREGLLPALRQQAGFRAYYAVRFDGGGGVFSVNVFDDLDAMTAANALALVWAASSPADLLVREPEVTTSDVKVHLDAQQPVRDAYVLVRMTDNLGPASSALPAVQERRNTGVVNVALQVFGHMGSKFGFVVVR
jgi:hypothetical protein